MVKFHACYYFYNWQGQQHQQETLIYADVSVTSKHNKKIKKLQTFGPTQPQDLDIDVEYSAIDHGLVARGDKHKKEVTEGNLHCGMIF